MSVIVRKPTEEEVKELKSCPKWGCDKSEFPWTYDAKEKCLILEGEVDVVTDEGTFSIKAGDYAEFAKGLSCTWKVHKAIDKHYKFE